MMGGMGRRVTLFTGQWADLPLAELAVKARSFGYDGLELACWGDHLDVDRAASNPAYCQARRDLFAEHGLGLRGMLFIEAVVKSAGATHKWTRLPRT